MTDNLAVAEPTTASAPYRWRWLAFSVALAASVMNLLDTLVTNIAAPSIRADIGGGPSVVQWLGAGYTLALAAGLITGGRLGDIYGRKRVLLTGVAGFTVASLLCAAATTPGMLIGARVLQGLAGAIMLPQGLGLIRMIFPPRELPLAFGAFGPVMGLATLSGPVLAGVLIDADLFGTGWRMIFLINLPLGLFILLTGARFIPGGQPRGTVRLDLRGAVIVALAALLLVYPVVQGRELGWPAWTFVLIALSLLLFVAFARVESAISRRGADPLVVPALFRNRAFTGGLATTLAVFTPMVGFGLVLTLFLQWGLGFSPLEAGLTVLPQAVGNVLGFLGGARLAHRVGRRMLHLGAVLMLSGVTGVILVLRIGGSDPTLWHLAPALLVYGVGLGLFLSPFFDIVLAGVRPQEIGSASGTLNAVQQFGGALGTAVVGTIFFGILAGQAVPAVEQNAAALRERLAVLQVSATDQDRIIAALAPCDHDRTNATEPGDVPASCALLGRTVTEAAAGSDDPAAVGRAVQDAGRTATRDAFSTALQRTLWVLVGLIGIAFALAFLLPPRARRYDDRPNAGTRPGTDARPAADRPPPPGQTAPPDTP